MLGAQIQLSHGRSWAHLASFPSGHLIVTAAMASAAAAAVPALRRPLLLYVALVGVTRITFGAHFPLDVLVGAALGYELGLFAARLMASARLLPEAAASHARGGLAIAGPRDELTCDQAALALPPCLSARGTTKRIPERSSSIEQVLLSIRPRRLA